MISNNKLDIISKDNQNSIYIKFLVTQRIKPSLIKEVIEEIIEEIKNSVLDIVLVLKTKPNNSILKLVKEYTNVQIMG